MLRQQADQFIHERVEGVRSCLIDLQRLCSYGHFQLEEHLLTVREMLAGIGEAHSAFNMTPAAAARRRQRTLCGPHRLARPREC